MKLHIGSGLLKDDEADSLQWQAQAAHGLRLVKKVKAHRHGRDHKAGLDDHGDDFDQHDLSRHGKPPLRRQRSPSSHSA